VLVVITALLSTVGGNASGATSDGQARNGRAANVKPTIAFIHGGWAYSSGWNHQVMALRHRGFPVIAPANPLPGLPRPGLRTPRERCLDAGPELPPDTLVSRLSRPSWNFVTAVPCDVGQAVASVAFSSTVGA
jgi:pimeloyl-ACP methyl ester carboxylesterase